MLEGLAEFDQELFLHINNGLHSLLGDIFLGYTTWLGEGFVLLPLCVVLTYCFDRNNFKRNLILLLIILVVGGLLNFGLKEYVQRLRPLAKFDGWKGPGFWNPGVNETYHVMFQPLMYKSFPSGHCMSAFAAATLFSFFYRQQALWFFLAAVIVMISRVYVGAHFPLDTVAGALLGVSVSFLVCKFFVHFYIPKFGGDAGVVKRTRL